MKYRRPQRQYQEMSARFTFITGSVGVSALHDCTDAMRGIVEALEQVADDPYSDLDSLADEMGKMVACTRDIGNYLGHIRNSCIRYCNAFEELAMTSPPPVPRIRLDPGSSSRWSRRSNDLPFGPWHEETPAEEPAMEDLQ